MIVLRSSIHWADIIVHTNGKCHVFTFLVCKRKIFLSILMLSVICVHFSQLVDHYVIEAYTS